MQQEIIELQKKYEKAVLNQKRIPELQEYVRSTICPMIEYYESLALDDLKQNEELRIELQTIIQALRLIYTYTGMDTGVDDSTYDVLCENLDIVSDMELEFTEPVTTLKPKGYHLYKSLRGTLDKVYYLSDKEKKPGSTRRSLDDWIRTSERAIKDATGKDVDLKEEYIYVFPKWDGVSVVLEYDEHDKLQRALTRGYTKLNEAIIVTDVFRESSNIGYNPHKNKKPYGIKLEVMTTTDDLLRYNLEHPEHPYKNTRSFASAIINNDDGIGAENQKYLHCIKLRSSFMDEDGESLQILDPAAFQTPHLYCKLKELDRIESFCDDHRFVNGLRCDGAVIYLINPVYQKILGRNNNKQKFEVAYKFTEEIQYGTVKGIEYSVGLYGSITPILKIEPLKMKGNKITRISLGSTGRLQSLGIGKGDTVKVGYDIIPVCSFDADDPKCKKIHTNPFLIPESCPVCGEKLEIKEITAKCTNPRCPTRVMGKIKSHVQRMRIQYLGDSIIEQLYNEGIIQNIPDIYKWKKKEDEILCLENFGKKKYKRILNEIEKAEGRVITESQLFSSLCIERLSSGTFDKIFNVMDMDTLMDIVDSKDLKTLRKVPGIGDVTAEWIINGLKQKDVKKTLKFLSEHLQVEHLSEERPFFTVVFTSFSKGNDERKEKIRELIREQKGKEVPRITKDTTYLIVPNHDVRSAKVEFAKIHQIPIFTPEEFIQRTIPIQ